MSASPTVPTVRTAAVSWGDVPGWVSAIAAMLALAAAVAAALYVKRQFEVMRDQRDVMNNQLDVMREQATADRDEIARQRAELAEGDRLRARAQAEQVDAKPGRHEALRLDIEAGTFPTLTITNSSSRPIRFLRCKAEPMGGDAPDRWAERYIGQLDAAFEFGEMRTVSGIPPTRFAQDTELRPPLMLRRHEHVTFLLEMDADKYPNTRFWVEFQDDAEQWWQLDSDMHLKAIKLDDRWAS